MQDQRRELTLDAYYTGSEPELPLAISPADRDWMRRLPEKFGNRCLPLLIANQAGWLVLSTQKVQVWWAGYSSKSSLRVTQLSGPEPCLASSHFGSGILTWQIPYLFRTPPGYNLLARGPANWPKDGIYPLEGIIETDWTASTFTMNWKITRRFKRIVFDIGEPICFIVPQKRGELGSFNPVVKALSSDPNLANRYERWASSRSHFNQSLAERSDRKGYWQKHYFRGQEVSDTAEAFAGHETKLALQPFVHGGDKSE